MSFIRGLLGMGPSAREKRSLEQHSRMLSQPNSQFSSSQGSKNSSASPHTLRKELLRLTLRETLNRNGIPGGWIAADALVATSRGREAGIHVRLLIKHWDPRLMVHSAAFQDNFMKRLITLDPLANNWMMGLSWQYALPDGSNYPVMPHPGTWTAMPPAEPGPTVPANLETSGGAMADFLNGQPDSRNTQPAPLSAGFASTEPAALTARDPF